VHRGGPGPAHARPGGEHPRLMLPTALVGRPGLVCGPVGGRFLGSRELVCPLEGARLEREGRDSWGAFGRFHRIRTGTDHHHPVLEWSTNRLNNSSLGLRKMRAVY
jgi:hypothetical protein